MYTEIENESYLLIWPTAKTRKVVEDVKKWRKRVEKATPFVLWGSGLAMLSLLVLPFVIPLTVATIVFSLLFLVMIVAGLIVALVVSHHEKAFRKLVKSDKAIHLYFDRIVVGEVGSSLVNEVLFAGERKLSYFNQRSVMKQLDRVLLDNFLDQPRNIAALKQCSLTTTQEASDAWREALEPQLTELIANAQPLIDNLQLEEATESRAHELVHEATVLRELAEVNRFKEQNKQ